MSEVVVSTFGDLKDLNYTIVPVGSIVRAVNIRSLYECVSATATEYDLDYTADSGIKLKVIGDVVPISAFGVVGSEESDDGGDTPRAQLALDWLAREQCRTLVWDVQSVVISGQLNLPDASRWCIDFPVPCIITQKNNNTPIFVFSFATRRYDFHFTGVSVVFKWEHSQSGSDVYAIAIAFKPTQSVDDGCYSFSFKCKLSIDNGYDLLGVHPDAYDHSDPDKKPFKAPYWGYEIASIQSQVNCVGRVFNLNSGTSAGAPAGVIDKVYIKSTNRANSAGCAFYVKAQNGLRINSIEVNEPVNRVLLLESCMNLSIGMLRFEMAAATLAASSDLIAVSGDASTVVIDTLEFQRIRFAGPGTTYGLVSNVNARVAITGVLNVNETKITNGGQFRAIQPQTLEPPKPVSWGRIILPPVILMNANENVRLYAANLSYVGPCIEFASAEAVGPWCLSNVAGSSNTFAGLMYDGTTTFTVLPSPVDGYLVGLFVYLTSAVTEGTLSVYPFINGAMIGSPAFNVQVPTLSNSGSGYLSPVYNPSIQAAHKISKGDALSVALNGTSVAGGGGASVMMLIARR